MARRTKTATGEILELDKIGPRDRSQDRRRPEQNLADLLRAMSPATRKQILDGLKQRACGLRLFSSEKRPGSKLGVTDELWVKVIHPTTGDLLYEGWLYTLAPDVQAAKTLLEHDAGKPGSRQVQQRDYEIRVVHRIPGRRNAVMDDVDDPVDPEIAAATVTFEDGESIGIGSVMQPAEPDDEPLIEADEDEDFDAGSQFEESVGVEHEEFD
jgi:hypothetical protein